MVFFLSPCRTWVEYKHGFGDLLSNDGEFWLGNDPLHYLTSQGMRYKDTCSQIVFTSIHFDFDLIF